MRDTEETLDSLGKGTVYPITIEGRDHWIADRAADALAIVDPLVRGGVAFTMTYMQTDTGTSRKIEQWYFERKRR